MMRKRSSKGGGAQRSIQVHLMVNEEEAAMIRAAARKRNQTVSLTIIEAVKLLEGRLQVEEEEHDSPTVQALREIEYQLRRIGRNVNQIAHNANREMNATIEDEASASYAVRQCRELVARLDSIIDQSGNG
ncbi:plasmid mobilization relaxosome protein MobC [Bifidobacterium catenulatum]|uniref:plasmid mobilization relaxosome protein MobC n=1 Tax=Bifidobacterium catenulatum TaxID=1686 RepID=UPI003D727F56